jgi:hypothetical protein
LSYVDDICHYVVNELKSERFFDNKTVSLSGTVIKLRNLGKIVEREYKTSGFLKWGAKPYRDHEVMTPPLYYKKVKLNQDSLQNYLMDRLSGNDECIIPSGTT